VTTRLLALCVPLAALSAACSGGHDVAAKEMSDLRAEIVKLRADNTVLAERIDALEIARGTYRGGPASAATAAPEDRPALDVVRLGPPAGGTDTSSDDADSDTPRPVVRSSGGAVVVEEKPAAKGGAAAQKEYDQALELARAKSYDKAIEGFTGFLARYPDHPNADNATYWRGEAYLGKGE
jgi:TolA-binding protein